MAKLIQLKDGDDNVFPNIVKSSGAFRVVTTANMPVPLSGSYITDGTPPTVAQFKKSIMRVYTCSYTTTCCPVFFADGNDVFIWSNVSQGHWVQWYELAI